jgi:hypothetical protein
VTLRRAALTLAPPGAWAGTGRGRARGGSSVPTPPASIPRATPRAGCRATLPLQSTPVLNTSVDNVLRTRRRPAATPGAIPRARAGTVRTRGPAAVAVPRSLRRKSLHQREMAVRDGCPRRRGSAGVRTVPARTPSRRCRGASRPWLGESRVVHTRRRGRALRSCRRRSTSGGASSPRHPLGARVRHTAWWWCSS